MQIDVSSLFLAPLMVGVALLMVGVSCYVIKYACDSFGLASNYLGRNMSSGIKGGTINAIGSSMPELLTGIAFVFTIPQLTAAEGFLSAIGVTAGSAVFNAVIIPALCILAVTVGKNALVKEIQVSRPVIIRDGLFLIAAELFLIAVLGMSVITTMIGVGLILIYAVYFGYMMYQHHTGEIPDEEEDDEDDDEDENPSLFTQIRTLDFNRLVFGGDYQSPLRAWGLLGLSVIAMGVACHFLAESVVIAATALDVPVYFTSVILAAAATSVPDTFLSVGDAKNGNYDDATANAIGSNIFDITVCTGVPILLYTIINGPINLIGLGSLEEGVQMLRIVLLGVTIAVIGMFLHNNGRLTKTKAYGMIALYLGWVGWIAVTAFNS